MASSPTFSPPPIDPAPGTPGQRTLGTGHNQAAAGDDARFATIPPTPPTDGPTGTPSLRTLGGGSQQAAAGNDARFPLVPDFVGVMDCVAFQAGSISASSATLTIAGANFQPSDVGKSIAVLGAGVAGAALQTQIASRTSTTVVVLAATASTSVTAARVWYGTNNLVALQTAITLAGANGTVRIAPTVTGTGTYMIVGTYTVPAATTLRLERGAVLCVPVPSTFTIAGPVRADEYKILEIGYQDDVNPVGADRVITASAYAKTAWWGPVNDMVTTTDGACTNGQPTFTSASTTFTAADIGKRLAYCDLTDGLGISGRIIALVSTHVVTLDTNATATKSGMSGGFGTPANAAFVYSTACAAAFTGEVQYPAGTYYFTGGQSSSFILNAGSSTRHTGHGSAATTLRLFPAQGSFSRLFSGFQATDWVVQGIHFDGNFTAQANVNSHQEQQHLLMVRDDCARVTIKDCTFSFSGGDQVFLFFQGLGTSRPSDVRISDCYFTGNFRTGVHAQQYDRCSVVNCNFIDTVGQVNVKQEPDSADEFGQGFIVANNLMEKVSAAGAESTFGVLFAGTSLHPTIGTTVVGNIMRGIGSGVDIGIYSQDAQIVGNTIDGCDHGISVTAYNAAYGFAGRRGTMITGNRIVRTRVGGNQLGILISNTQNFTVVGNTVEAVGTGINVIHSENGVVEDNVVVTSAAASFGLLIERTKSTSIRGNTIVQDPWTEGTDGAIGAGSTAFGSAAAVFAIGDVGKTIRIDQVGPSGAPLTTTIAAFVDVNHVTLTAATTGASFAFGAPFRYGVDAVGGYAIYADDAYSNGTFDYPTQDLLIRGNTVVGHWTHEVGCDFGSPNTARIAVEPSNTGAATITLPYPAGLNVGPGVLTEIQHADRQRVAADGVVHRHTYGTSIPSAAAAKQAYAVGDVHEDVGAPTIASGSKRWGWYCSVAQVPPAAGTFVEIWQPLSSTFGGLTGTLTTGRVPFASGASALTDDAGLTYGTGRLSVTGQIRGADGTAAAPWMAPTSQPDMGLYKSAADTLGLAASGHEAVRIQRTADTIVTIGSTANNGGATELHLVTNSRALTIARLDNNTGQILFAPVSDIEFGANQELQLHGTTTGLSVGCQFQEFEGSSVASATSITPGNANVFAITGSAPISFIATTGWQSGARLVLRFGATCTVLHNAASPPAGFAAVLLSFGASYTFVAGETLTVRRTSSGGWVEEGPGSAGRLIDGKVVEGSLSGTAIAAPATPGSGHSKLYLDSTSLNWAAKNAGGLVSHLVRTSAPVSSTWVTAIDDNGNVQTAQPSFSDLQLGTLSLDQLALARATALVSAWGRPTTFAENFVALPGTAQSQWTAAGTGGTTTRGTGNGGTVVINSGAGAGNDFNANLVGSPTLVTQMNNQKFYVLARAKITTTPGANTLWQMGFFDVAGSVNCPAMGVRGTHSTTKYAAFDQSGANALSTVTIDANYHIFEMWGDNGGTVFLAVDFETLISFSTARTVAATGWIQISNGGTAANQSATLDHLVYVLAAPA